MEIRVEQTAGATVKVGWCLNKTDRKELSTKGVLNAHVLFVIVSHYGKKELEVQEYDRKLVPIGELLTYISLAKSGKNTILAKVVWVEGNEDLQDAYLSTRFGRFETNVLMHSVLEFRNLPTSLGSFAISEVEVSKEFFAKEPSAFEKWWVNLWYESEPVDQCHFRKRRILAYTLQPVAVILYVLLISVYRSITAFTYAFLRAYRRINFKPIWHPFMYDNNDIYLEAVNSTRRSSNWFWYTKDEKDRPFMDPWFAFLHPISVLLGTCIFLGISYFIGIFDLRIILECIILGTLSMALIMFAGILGGMIFTIFPIAGEAFERIFSDRARAISDRRWESLRVLQKEKLKQDLEFLTCGNAPLALTVSALPKEKQTLKLRFFDLKARVCKPFAR
jgi:hypothetical protein